MEFLQVVLAVAFGILLGLWFARIRRNSYSAAGEFIIKQNDEGQFSYVLKLEEEPEGLHNSRYIFFKVKKSH